MAQQAGKRATFGTLMLLLSGLCWSSIAILSKIGIESGLNAITVNMARMFVGGGFVFLYLVIFRRNAFRVGFKSVLLLFVLGIMDYAIGGLLFLGSLHFIDASLSFLVLYSYPAVVVIISGITGRERFSVSRLAAVLLTIVGVGFVLEAGLAIRGEEWLGVLMVLGGALIFSVYLVVVETMLEDVRPSAVSFYSLLGGAVGVLFIIPFFRIEWEAAMQPLNALILLNVAVVSTAIALVTFLIGVRHVGATRAAVITTLEPVFVIAVASLFLGEQLSIWQMIGVALQLLGVFWVHRVPHRQPEPGPV
jgi:drug/metabolite transporter (DMT)-like permease